ncbi:MAG: cobalt ECF transporter T component CbiQ [Sedimentisphaeraceae bacterium JB056]
MHHAHIDKYANNNTFFHRLDSRGKLVMTIIFTILVVTSGKGVAYLAWYLLWPFTILAIGQIPFRFVIKQLAIVSPFIIVLAISSVFYNREPVDVRFGPFQWHVSNGVIQFFNIVIKFSITVCSLIAMVSTTRFDDLLAGMEKLGMPRLIVSQLGFLYRYIFLLIDRVGRMLRARKARSLRNLGFSRELNVASSMIGSLLINSIDMAGRVGVAMEGRGFDGRIRTLRMMKFEAVDVLFVCISAMYMVCLRVFA